MTSMPSRSGMTMSSRMMSGRTSSAFWSASSPLLAVTTRKPSSPRAIETSFVMRGSSSATRTRGWVPMTPPWDQSIGAAARASRRGPMVAHGPSRPSGATLQIRCIRISTAEGDRVRRPADSRCMRRSLRRLESRPDSRSWRQACHPVQRSTAERRRSTVQPPLAHRVQRRPPGPPAGTDRPAERPQPSRNAHRRRVGLRCHRHVFRPVQAPAARHRRGRDRRVAQLARPGRRAGGRDPRPVPRLQAAQAGAAARRSACRR